MKKKKIVEKEFDDGFDSDDDELMNQRVHLLLSVRDI